MILLLRMRHITDRFILVYQYSTDTPTANQPAIIITYIFRTTAISTHTIITSSLWPRINDSLIEWGGLQRSGPSNILSRTILDHSITWSSTWGCWCKLWILLIVMSCFKVMWAEFTTHITLGLLLTQYGFIPRGSLVQILILYHFYLTGNLFVILFLSFPLSSSLN